MLRAEAAEATVRTLETHVASLQQRLGDAEQEGRRISDLLGAERVPRPGGRSDFVQPPSPSRDATLERELQRASQREQQRAATIAGAEKANVTGTRNVAALGAPLVYYSSDYVFSGTKGEPYLESDAVAPASGYGRSKLAGEREVAQAAPGSHTVVRSSWLFGANGHCFPRTIARLAAERDELRVVSDQIGCPTFTGDLAQALLELAQTRPLGVLHVAAAGECSWYEFASEIVAASGADCRVSPCTTEEFPRPAPRPAYSVLGSEREDLAPALPHWRDGLAAYLLATREPVA